MSNFLGRINEDLRKRAEDLKQLRAFQEETLGRAKAKLLTTKNKEIVIRNLKLHIQNALVSQESEIAEKTKKHKTLALENKLESRILS